MSAKDDCPFAIARLVDDHGDLVAFHQCEDYPPS